MTDAGADRIEVPYLPFIDADNCDPALFPDYVRRCLDLEYAEPVPGLGHMWSPESILRLYLNDIEYLIFPEVHRDSAGYTFTNVSYYTTASDLAALSEYCDGVSRATVSIGMVCQLAGLAHAGWRALVPILFREDPPEPAVPGLELRDLLAQRQVIDHEAFQAIIRPYPRLLGYNPDHEGGYEGEYLLFADMLRFTWCHEWLHGLSGHPRALRERFGISGLGEIGTGHSQGEAALMRRAFEFEADAIATLALTHQIMADWDIPGRLVEFRSGLGGRLALLLIGISIMIAQWREAERNTPARDRSHPSAGLRYLRLWDTVRERVAEAGQDEALTALAGTAAAAMFRLGEVAPAFVDLQAVTPVAVRTPPMDNFRAEMVEYHELIKRIDPTLVRHNIDGSVGDLIPHRASG